MKTVLQLILGTVKLLGTIILAPAIFVLCAEKSKPVILKRNQFNQIVVSK